MKSKQEFNFKDRYFSDRVEKRINRMQFFLRIGFIIMLVGINIGLPVFCILFDLVTGSCPVVRFFPGEVFLAYYFGFTIFIALFFSLAVLIRKRIHDLGYSGNIIFWIFRGFIVWTTFILILGHFRDYFFHSMDTIQLAFLDSILGFAEIDTMLYLYMSIIGGVILTIWYLLFCKGISGSSQYGERR